LGFSLINGLDGDHLIPSTFGHVFFPSIESHVYSTMLEVETKPLLEQKKKPNKIKKPACP
jgi:hypothetical protein